MPAGEVWLAGLQCLLCLETRHTLSRVHAQLLLWRSPWEWAQLGQETGHTLSRVHAQLLLWCSPWVRAQPGQETRHSQSRVHAQLPFSNNHGGGWGPSSCLTVLLEEWRVARRLCGGCGPVLHAEQGMTGMAYYTHGLHILVLVQVLQSLTHPVHPPELVADLRRCTVQCQHIASY